MIVALSPMIMLEDVTAVFVITVLIDLVAEISVIIKMKVTDFIMMIFTSTPSQ